MKLIQQPDMFDADIINVSCGENGEIIGKIITKGPGTFKAESSFKSEATFTSYPVALKFLRAIAAKRMKYEDSTPNRQKTLNLL